MFRTEQNQNKTIDELQISGKRWKVLNVEADTADVDRFAQNSIIAGKTTGPIVNCAIAYCENENNNAS